MCGIIGYVGQRPAKELLLQGLERLEYRGYDSAGLALREEGGLDYVRTVGNLQALKEAAGDNGSVSTTGLGHTRWATHGRVSEQNAHPLSGCAEDQVAVVLNGIVENFRELKEASSSERACNARCWSASARARCSWPPRQRRSWARRASSS